MIYKQIHPGASVVLDFMRGTSAQLVLIGHLLSFYGIQQEYKIPIIQNFGVLVFFVLSGFLITQTTFLKGKEYGYKNFFIDRFVRIFYSFIPAILLVAILDYILIQVGVYDQDKYNNSILNFFGNILMLHAYPFAKQLGIEAFGTGRIFWTVAVEWWIYIAFGFLYYFWNKRKVNIWHKVSFVISIPLVFFYIGFRGDGLSVMWFYGFLVAIFYNKLNLNFKRYMAVVVFLMLAMLLRVYFDRDMYDAALASLFSITLLILMLSDIKLFTTKWFHKFSNFLASFSYSLYLIHYSLISVYIVFFPAESLVHIVVIYLLVNILSYVFYLFFEKKQYQARRRLKEMLR